MTSCNVIKLAEIILVHITLRGGGGGGGGGLETHSVTIGTLSNDNRDDDGNATGSGKTQKVHCA